MTNTTTQKTTFYCAMCQSHRDGIAQIMIDGFNGDTYHILCSECSVSTYIFVALGNGVMQSKSCILDLSYKETLRHAVGDAVSIDDVILTTDMLENHENKMFSHVRLEALKMM